MQPGVTREPPSNFMWEVIVKITHFGLGLHIAFGMAVMGLAGGAAGQTNSRPVPGTTLKQWLDNKAAYAGVHKPSGCTFMNHAEDGARGLYMICPDGRTHKMKGTLEVRGDQWCSRFGGSGTDECVTWHAVGVGKYEQRSNGAATAVVYMLAPAGK